MTVSADDALIDSVRHYLSQISSVLHELSKHPRADALLETAIAPDMFNTGLNFAVGIQFAARALCLPAYLPLPEFPETFSCAQLRLFCDEVSALIAPISASSFSKEVMHQAGEGSLTQDSFDYLARFALPNMIFHFTMAYAGLRSAGYKIGKSDFDGLHVYEMANSKL